MRVGFLPPVLDIHNLRTVGLFHYEGLKELKHGNNILSALSLCSIFCFVNTLVIAKMHAMCICRRMILIYTHLQRVYFCLLNSISWFFCFFFLFFSAVLVCWFACVLLTARLFVLKIKSVLTNVLLLHKRKNLKRTTIKHIGRMKLATYVYALLELPRSFETIIWKDQHFFKLSKIRCQS